MINETEKNNFLGTGIHFPIKINPSTGKIETAQGKNLIEQSIKLLLSTKPGERLYHSNYGIDLTPLLFEIPNDSTLKEIEERIKDSIVLFLPMIIVDTVDFEINALEGLIYIQIGYIVKVTNARANYVYPFYIKEANQ